MQQPDFAAAAHYAIARLEHELDPRLSYHSLSHTRDDVLPAAERLAALAGVGGEALLLLRTAAVYHDLGFLLRRAEHETASAALAAATLPGFGYTQAQVAAVGELIMATRMPQTPRSPLGELLADADLDLLGRDDFMNLNERLRVELQAFGDSSSQASWCRGQIAFLSSHRYWSAAARGLRDAGKAANLSLLHERLVMVER